MTYPARNFLIRRRAVLAAAPAFLAFPALAGVGPELLKGSVAKFDLAKEPKELPTLAFSNSDDKALSLGDYITAQIVGGKVTMLGNVVQNTYVSNLPFAAAAANAVAKTYIEQSRDSRFNTSKDAADWLNDRLAEYRRALMFIQKHQQLFTPPVKKVKVNGFKMNVRDLPVRRIVTKVVMVKEINAGKKIRN